MFQKHYYQYHNFITNVFKVQTCPSAANYVCETSTQVINLLNISLTIFHRKNAAIAINSSF